MRTLLIGLGAIGKSFLRLLKENELFDPDEFYCTDCNSQTKDYFLQMGGFASHFLSVKIEKDNYMTILDGIETEGFVLDFGNDIKNLEMLEYCLQKGIHYLSLADASWYPDPTWVNTYRHYIEYRKIRQKYPSAALPTCIVEFGMNPGLISCFLKQCIDDIVAYDDSAYIRRHRRILSELLEQQKYNIVAKKLGIRYIVEIDNDTQHFSVSTPAGEDAFMRSGEDSSTRSGEDAFMRSGEDSSICSGEAAELVVSSPWSPCAFHMEMLSAPEISYGTKKDFLRHRYLSDYNIADGFAALTRSAVNCRETIFSPQGEVNGVLSTHEEIFSMSDYLKYKRYKPTAYFVYSPSEQAFQSVLSSISSEKVQYHLFTKNEYIDGGESVGIILQGKHFKTRYYGNYLESTGLPETATVLQVSASAFAAYCFLLENPSCGLLFPEELPHTEILSCAKKYLKEYISTECPDVTPSHGLDGCDTKR
ncbi:MAG: saccharopine dehydrogenase NADP-binding domain-containing protein [Lachnospiraceae bacterium]